MRHLPITHGYSCVYSQFSTHTHYWPAATTVSYTWWSYKTKSSDDVIEVTLLSTDRRTTNREMPITVGTGQAGFTLDLGLPGTTPQGTPSYATLRVPHSYITLTGTDSPNTHSPAFNLHVVFDITFGVRSEISNLHSCPIGRAGISLSPIHIFVPPELLVSCCPLHFISSSVTVHRTITRSPSSH